MSKKPNFNQKRNAGSLQAAKEHHEVSKQVLIHKVHGEYDPKLDKLASNIAKLEKNRSESALLNAHLARTLAIQKRESRFYTRCSVVALLISLAFVVYFQTFVALPYFVFSAAVLYLGCKVMPRRIIKDLTERLAFTEDLKSIDEFIEKGYKEYDKLKEERDGKIQDIIDA
jgi:hypothetical protein